jgi:predicted nucleic acid-binding protein
VTPNDDFIIATAVVGKAEYLVTLDKDLLVLKKHEGISIVTPTQFKELQI